MTNYKKAFFELMYQGAFEYATDAMQAAASCNRVDLEVSARCGCFTCGTVFGDQEALNWADDDLTAVCPHCGAASIAPDTQGGYSVSEDFLSAYIEFRKTLPPWRLENHTNNRPEATSHVVFVNHYSNVDCGADCVDDSLRDFTEIPTMLLGDIRQFEPEDLDAPALSLALMREGEDLVVMSGLDGSLDVKHKLEPNNESRLWYPDGESYGMWEFVFCRDGI